MSAESKLAGDPRLEAIGEALLQWAAGNLDARLTPSPLGDEIDAMMSGLNMLVEEMAAYRASQEQTRDKALFQSLHDDLTGLPNRAMFLQSIESAQARIQRYGGSMAVLFIDLDKFKQVNDVLGHLAGDELLRQVGPRIRSLIRATDVLARQGGDEFLLLMTSPDEDRRAPDPEGGFAFAVVTVASRIIEALKRPFSIQNQDAYVGASIGISLFPDDAKDGDSLLQHADSAMYHAKELGRGGFQLFSGELSAREHRHLMLATQLHKALERQEFSLEYQPVIDLAAGTMAGVEALIRWQTGNGERVAPAEFIPVAEEIGMIGSVGDWVLEEAGRQLHEWQEMGFTLKVAVNLSAGQFWQDGLAAKIIDVIDRFGISGSALELEVTESAMARDPVRMEEVLREFKARGLSVALDDFGTGYSSLSRLKKLPIGKLKIDKSFVDGLPEDQDDVSIVTAIIQLARNLAISALAEGIETIEQWRLLRDLGCEFGQGYYFSHAVPAAEIAAMVDRKQSWKLEQQAAQVVSQPEIERPGENDGIRHLPSELRG